ncbi:MAG: RnfABCDGE type electron transport complex subunit D, partial [Spirochaetales bacterium]|nr:RnfABCDGE type electron transport complex subunit D [Spirochaetales bacterium]
MSASNKPLYPPYTHDWRTSANATWIASATLVPMVLWSSMLYGSFAVRVWVVSIAVAMISEAVASGLLGKWTLGDGSAVLTGLLIASAMPPGVPWYVPASSAAFAIFIVKAAFGGLGSNWMNPALAGLAFAYGNWPMAMRQFLVPKMVSGVDGVSASTPLYFAKGLSGGFDGRVMDAL